MKEIKFRAWDNCAKQMIYKHYYIGFSGEIKPYNDSLILMQYTGLKDKNGKEIYEGDICIIYELTNTREVGKGLVVYDELECLYAIDKTPLQYHVYNTATNNPRACLKVIGNIYENPELLE